MQLDHTAIYVQDLERMKTFYETYFGAVANRLYHNPKTGLYTYFLSFEQGARLEIMTRPEVSPRAEKQPAFGYAHLAFRVGSREKVNELTKTLRQAGYIVTSEPRVTGDGYYESCICDPEGNLVELVA